MIIKANLVLVFFFIPPKWGDIENEYARAVYTFFSSIRPVLIRKRDGSIHEWSEDYGCAFDEIPTLLRHSLVGLIEGTGKYKLA